MRADLHLKTNKKLHSVNDSSNLLPKILAREKKKKPTPTNGQPSSSSLSSSDKRNHNIPSVVSGPPSSSAPAATPAEVFEAGGDPPDPVQPGPSGDTVVASATLAGMLEFVANWSAPSSEGRDIPEDDSVELSSVSVPSTGCDASCGGDGFRVVAESFVEMDVFCGVEGLEPMESVALSDSPCETVEFIGVGLIEESDAFCGFEPSEVAELAVEFGATVLERPGSGVTSMEGTSGSCKLEWE